MPTARETQGWTPSAVPRAIVKLDEVRALPQAWLFGLLYTYQSALARPTYLNGVYSQTGWWYYFPLTMLYKTPLTLMAALIAAAAIARRVLRLWEDVQVAKARWTTLCLAIPPLLYLIAAMRSNLNLGLRHVLPVYPFLYIAVGIAAARLYAMRPVVAKRAIAIFMLAAFVEALIAFPNYIAFFNAAVGGTSNGINLLGDSNLDWSQDLKLLAEWRQKHPQERLYLLYFGLADPWAYGIENYINVPGGYKFGPEFQFGSDPIRALRH